MVVDCRRSTSLSGGGADLVQDGWDLCHTTGAISKGVLVYKAAVLTFGPPMAPRRTASADFAAARASSVRGFW